MRPTQLLPHACLPTPGVPDLPPGMLTGRRGLGLLEAILMIAFVGLLQSFAAVLGSRRVQKNKTMDTAMTMVKVAESLEMHAHFNDGVLPSEEQGLEALLPYLPDQVLPVDAWDRSLVYRHPSTESSLPYDLLSLGRDGVPGGEGFDADILHIPLEER